MENFLDNNVINMHFQNFEFFYSKNVKNLIFGTIFEFRTVLAIFYIETTTVAQTKGKD